MERLELLRELLDGALERESPCDLGAAPAGRALNESILFAHFAELAEPLREWDELQLRARCAPDRVWARVADACREHHLSEPPVALGGVVDKLAILTCRRAREWRLEEPERLALKLLKDRVGGLDHLTLYLERERISSLPDPGAGSERALAATAAAIQAIFDELQHGSEARSISATRDALLELKHDLIARLSSLTLRSAQEAPGCPMCEGAARRGAAAGAGGAARGVAL